MPVLADLSRFDIPVLTASQNGGLASQIRPIGASNRLDTSLVAYAAGELKHGSLALMDETVQVVVIAPPTTCCRKR